MNFELLNYIFYLSIYVYYLLYVSNECIIIVIIEAQTRRITLFITYFAFILSISKSTEYVLVSKEVIFATVVDLGAAASDLVEILVFVIVRNLFCDTRTRALLVPVGHIITYNI